MRTIRSQHNIAYMIMGKPRLIYHTVSNILVHVHRFYTLK